MRDNDDQPHKYMLQGVVYFGSSHLVSHIVDDNLYVWFNDGIATKRKYIREKVLQELTPSDLHSLTIGHSLYHSCFVLYRKN